MSIAIIFKSNTYETNHKGEITEVIPPLLFQQLINLLFQFFRRSDVMLFQEDDRLRDCIDVVTLSPHLIAFALSGAQLAFDVDQPLDLH